MQTKRMYLGLAAFALAVAIGAVVIALLGVALAQPTAAGAAAICAVVFFIPGLAFFNYARRLRSRDLALRHVGRMAESSDVVDITALAADLGVPREHAERILRRAEAEGHVRGSFREDGRFVVAGVLPCPACGESVRRDAAGMPCPRCGATIQG